MLPENLIITNENIFFKIRFLVLNSSDRYIFIFLLLFLTEYFVEFKGTGLTKGILIGELVLKLEQKENLQKILLEQNQLNR